VIRGNKMYNINDLKSKGIKIVKIRDNNEVLANCPFHKDVHPSFVVNLQKGLYFCFSCGSKGRLINFGIENNTVTFEDFRSIIIEDKNIFIKQIPLPKDYIKISTHPKYYGRDAEKFIDYLVNRSIGLDIIEQYNIGYCLNGYYKNRIIIPLDNGFVARSLHSDIKGKLLYGKDYRKYLYPLGFRKSECLFNLDNSANVIVLVEGVMDALKLVSMEMDKFIGNPVAILGSELSDYQYDLLCTTKTKNIILCFDGDEAGRKCTELATEKLSGSFYVNRITLPEGKDPGDMERNEFIKCVNEINYKEDCLLSYDGQWTGFEIKHKTFIENYKHSKEIEKYYQQKRSNRNMSWQNLSIE
jgi:DNA primase